ncbi:MAG: hypothetical protein AAFQ29_10675 [Pseudomonadota bacterium]
MKILQQAMRMPMRVMAAMVGCLVLAACVTSTPYGPADRTGFGYSDQKIDSNRFRVTFRGNSSTDRETVENFLLFRAAELTVQNGFDHFIVVENDTEARSYFRSLYGPSYAGGFGPFYGRYGFRRRFGAFPYYPYGFGFGPGFGPGFYGANEVRETTQYTAIAFISLHQGTKPSDEPAAFSAREVLENLRPLIVEAE